LARVALLVFFGALLCSPLAEAAEGPPVYSPGCADPARPTAAQQLRSLDAGVSFGGTVFLRVEGEGWLWKQGNQLQHYLGEAERLAAPGTGALDQSIKYRAGRFWAQRNREVLVYDGPAHRWAPVLTALKSFEAFEVTHDGRILLIGAGDHLLETYEQATSQPTTSIDAPKLKAPATDKNLLDFYWERPLTASFQEFILIYFPRCGRLFVYNTLGAGLKEVATPWAPLDPAKVRGMAEAEGMVALYGFPGSSCLQFLPGQGLSVQLAYRIRRRTGSVTREVRDGRTLLDFGPTTLDPLQVVELDLEQASLSPAESRGDLSLPLWISPKGKIVPLAMALPTPERAERMTKKP
jgi:hypothetical protein